jgi:hypothetical protein
LRSALTDAEKGHDLWLKYVITVCDCFMDAEGREPAGRPRARRFTANRKWAILYFARRRATVLDEYTEVFTSPH